MFKKFLCIVSACIIILSGCCEMVEAQSELIDFREMAVNGKTRIYNNNEQFVKKYAEAYRESGCQSIEEYVEKLIKGQDLPNLAYTYIYAGSGIEFEENNDLFLKAAECFSLPTNANPEGQYFVLSAIYDVKNNSNNVKMKEYAEGLLQYFEKRSVPDKNTMEETLKVLDAETKDLKLNESDLEKLVNSVKFQIGDTHTKYECNGKKNNIHEIRQPGFKKLAFSSDYFKVLFQDISGNKQQSLRGSMDNKTIDWLYSNLCKKISILNLNHALSAHYILDYFGITPIIYFNVNKVSYALQTQEVGKERFGSYLGTENEINRNHMVNFFEWQAIIGMQENAQVLYYAVLAKHAYENSRKYWRSAAGIQQKIQKLSHSLFSKQN